MKMENDRIKPDQVQMYLRGIDYPISKEELIAHAQEKGADETVLSALAMMPGERFESPSEVSQAIGEEA
jgi:hypothetical protein